MNNKPVTTLFLLTSVDGKINSGATDDFDVDKDFSRIPGVMEGLSQYYDIESETDLHSLNTGRVFAKLGINNEDFHRNSTPCEFIVIDNKPHLTKTGIKNLCSWTKKLYLVTTNENHPAYNLDLDNIEIIKYDKLDLNKLLTYLKSKGIDKITIESGGNLNGLFVRNNLIDYVHIVVAPLLVGGKNVSTLVDGESITNINELKSMKLIKCNVLKDSYIELIYKINKE